MSSRATALDSRRPSGRAELLQWINHVSCAAYPTIASLRDGLGYLTLVEATIARTTIAPTAGSSSSESTSSLAHSLIQKADHNVAEHLYAAGGSGSALEPEVDSMQTRERCERNFHTLQDMIRRCISDKAQRVELDVKRLGAGKLQDHLRLLQWSVGFVEHRFANWNRQLQQQQQPQAGTPLKANSGRVGRPTTSAAEAAARRRTTSASGATAAARRTTNTADENNRDEQPMSSSSRGLLASANTNERRLRASSASAGGPARTSSLGAGATPRSSDVGGGGGGAKFNNESNEDDDVQQRVFAARERTTAPGHPPPPPASSISDVELATLLAEVEGIEDDVIALHMDGADVAGDVSNHNGGVGSAAGGANNLQTITGLLRERDALWHTLAAVEAVLWRSIGEEKTGLGASIPHSLSPMKQQHGVMAGRSMLLQEACALFQIV